MTDQSKSGPLNIRVEPATVIRGPPDAYKNDAQPRGVFFIANWNKFDDDDILEERCGSEVDVANLKSLFSQSGYACVGELLDSTEQELFDALHSLKEKKVLKTVDSFVGIFMSHGNQYVLYARNGDEIKIEEIIKCFSEDSCPFLEGKPKVFILQNCRSVASIESDKVNQEYGSHYLPRCTSYGLNLRGVSDTYLCHSTLPGEVSFRDEINGACYIQSLCRVFMENAKDTEIYSLIGKINRKAETDPDLLYCDFQALGHKYDFYFNPTGIQNHVRSSLNETQHVPTKFDKEGTCDNLSTDDQSATSQSKSKSSSCDSDLSLKIFRGQRQSQENPSKVLPSSDEIYDLRRCPRGFIYVLNNIKGCEDDVQKLMFIFNQLGYETIHLTEICSYQSLKETIQDTYVNPNANLIVCFLGYGYDDVLFLGQSDKESLSYKKLCELFRQKQEKGNALVLLTNTCFKNETPDTIIYDELKEPVLDTFHVCVKVDGDCQKGSLLTKALLQELEDNGFKKEIGRFARNIAYYIDYMQTNSQDTYFSDFRCYGISKHFYFISPFEEEGRASGSQRRPPQSPKWPPDRDPQVIDSDDSRHPTQDKTHPKSVKADYCLTSWLQNSGLDSSKFRKLFTSEGISTLQNLQAVVGDKDKLAKLLSKMSDGMRHTFLHNAKHKLEAAVKQEDILQKLGLTQYYPGKITLETVGKRCTERLDKLADVPWYVLNKILMLNYRGRDDMLPESTTPNVDIVEESKEATLKDDLEDLFSDCLDESSKYTSAIHPLDVIIAIMHCSSNLLQQIFCEKMYMCKLGIPLVLPQFLNNNSILLLWSLRDVLLSDGLSETSIISCPIPIVTFLRLGSVSRSKSKFINEILNNQSHNTFYNRDCDNGKMNKILSSGLAEIAWYLPVKKSVKDHLNEPVAFINVRGDVKMLGKSCELVYKMSNIAVVMVDIDELEDSDVKLSLRLITSSNVELILLLSKKQNKDIDVKSQESIRNYIREMKCDNFSKQNMIKDFAHGEKNIKDLKKEVIAKINISLKRKQSRRSLESYKCLAQSLNIQVDEDKPDFLKAQKLAIVLTQDIEKDNSTSARLRKLPLQCEPWQEWGKLEKEKHRLQHMADTSPDHYINDLKSKQKQLRRDQISILGNPSFLFKTFIQDLLMIKCYDRIKFLKWLKYYLDDISRKTLPGLKKDRSEKWKEIRHHKTTNQLDEELIRLDNKIVEASFGLEHFMREIGQFYEAVSSLKKEAKSHLKKVYKLPQLMAKLMLSGYPLELMDGDASHVPLLWVQAVLEKLKGLIGDKKIFVLSVLGIQSSGKSTLLNTMFGLQFAVGAGRCTRGVYAQLVPLSSGDPKMKYEYILVVDTEGLRAPELGMTKLQHDNEIATLVIGLGDATLVNIKGENHAEMQDIFQIVIHALLKMKLVNKSLKLQPSCIFLHQNVGALDAATKMENAQHKFLDILDSVTKAAGQQEDAPHLCKFNDIIEFDMENVWYFSDLWEGDPPMAPANPGYSEKVNAVKQALIKTIMPSRAHCSTISDVNLKVKDVWKGILSENFVFSFKNSLELNAYNSLDAKYSDLSSSLKRYAINWSNANQHYIMNCEDEIDYLESSLEAEFTVKFAHEHNEKRQLLDDFFKNHKSKEILEQWKANMLITLKTCYEEILLRTKTNLKNEVSIRKIQLEQINDMEKYKREIRLQAKESALILKHVEDINEEEIEHQFNQMWVKWIKTISNDYMVNPLDVKGTVKGALYDIFHGDIPLLEAQLENLCVPLENIGNCPYIYQQRHLKIVGLFEQAKNFVGWKDYTNDAEKEVNDLFREVKLYLVDLEEKNFMKMYAEAIIKMIIDKANNLKEKKIGFEFRKEFVIYLAVHVCRFAIPKFSKMCERFMRRINPKMVFEENYKEAYFTEFKNICKQSTQEKIAADTIASYLNRAVMNAVDKELPEVLHRYATKVTTDETNDADCNIPELRTKAKFLKSVLSELLIEDSFDRYCEYICDLDSCLMNWVQYYVNKYFASRRDTSKSVYVDIALSMVDNIVKHIISQVNDAKEQAESEKKGTDLFPYWIELFYNGIFGKLTISKSDLLTASQSKFEDLFSFTKLLKTNLNEIQKSLKDYFVEQSKAYLTSTDKGSVCRLLFEKCAGCTQQCPYCRAPCSYSNPCHQDLKNHTAYEHFPQGVRGVYSDGDIKVLATESCSVLVACNSLTRVHSPDGKYYPHNEYKKYFPEWNIESEASLDGPVYWKRFMAKFGSKLAEKYHVKEPEIPNKWNDITIDDVMESLKEM